ncbi:putative ribosomal protein L25 [Candidatus Carsonella ruddii CS isolate Thao2000]|uniref:Putative ribosomal protein L25 n=1 Tax=Candidatus Carsonella ruddii CS isolate Thao2000 TaxID=1202537 RepID=J7GT73_CARRU|nr:hypothetical protein [Candidatus Carsonella ruddii]AFP83709.1 putative ribosomal protein L25 [Candidatus Carsonella ruddii CS isolate Thao2000]
MHYKFKYKLKVFKRKFKIKKKIIIGDLFINNKFIKIYILKNNYLEIILKNNFFKIKFMKKKYNVFINNKIYNFINNRISYFSFIEINKNKNIKIFYKCNSNYIVNNFLILTNNIKIPRKLYLSLTFFKKKIKDKDYLFKNFKKENKILFLNKKK